MADDDWGLSGSVGRQMRILSISIEFESELRRDENPSIDDYILRVPECDRPLLKRELECVLAEVRVGRSAVVEQQPTEPGTGWQPSSATSLQRTQGPTFEPCRELLPGERLGRYIIEARIGIGGMGVVYRALDPLFARRVAVKVLRIDGPTDDKWVERFRNECRTIAKINHEHVVPIYDTGEEGGLHYVVMKCYARGSLADELKAKNAPLRSKEAARLLAPVARAIHACHELGVIHRDLKPGNLLLDDAGRAIVSDFGLAKSLADEGLSRAGEPLGTPGYMAPEQFRDPASVHSPADIYGLGATLYHLAGGGPPHRAASWVETQRQTLEDDPIPLRRQDRSISRDYETVCLKCLEKRPERRYATALELAEELERVVRGEPIKTRPIGYPERLTRWAARRPQLASMSALAVIGAVVSLVMLILLWIADQERIRRLQRDAYFRDIQLAAEAYNGGLDERAAELLSACPEPHRGLEWRLLHNLCDTPPASRAIGITGLLSFCFGPDSERLLTAGRGGHLEVHEGPKAFKLSPATPEDMEKNFEDAVWLPAGKGPECIFAADRNGSTRAWERRDGTWREVPLPLAHSDAIEGVVADPLARRVLTAGADRRVVEWTRTEYGWLAKELFRGPTEFWALAMAPDGNTIAAATSDRRVRLHHIGSPKVWAEELGELKDTVLCLSFGGERFLAAGAADGSVVMWDRATRAHRSLRGLPSQVMSVCFSPDGRRIVAGDDTGLIRFWDTSDGHEALTLRGPSRVVKLSFNPDGSKLAGAFDDGMILSWSTKLERGRALPQAVGLTRHEATIVRIAVSANGRYVASVGMDGALHVRDLDTGVDRDLLEGVPETARVKLNRVIIDAEGRRVAAGGRDGIVRIWDLGSGKLLRKLEDLKGKRIGGLDFSPSNRWIAATDDHGWLALWPLDSVGSPCLVHLSHQELFAAAFDETESFIAAAGADRVVLVWPLHQPDARPRELFGHQDMVGDVKFGPGGVLASASDDGTIIIWDVGKQAIIKRLKAHPGGVWDIAFDSSRRWMATAGQDRKARIWDTESWEQVGANQERERVCGVAFGPRAEYVVFGGSSRVVKRWDIRDALANAPGAAKSSRREAATPADRR